MKNLSIFLTLFILTFLLIVLVESSEKIEIKTFETNKLNYFSGEEMKVRIKIVSDSKKLNVTLFGIKDRFGKYRIWYSNVFPVNDTLELNLTFKLPSCYGCAGISPGNYSISLLVKNRKILKRSLLISIQP